MPRSEVCGSYNFRSASVRRPQPKIRVRIRDRSRLLSVIHCQSASPRPSSITSTLSCNPWAQSSSRGSGLCRPYLAACLIVCTLYVCLSVCLRITLCYCPLLQFLAAGAWQGAARCPLCAAAVPTAHTIHLLRPALSDLVSVSMQLYCD